MTEQFVEWALFAGGMALVAALAGAHVRRRLVAQLEQQGLRDPLTSLANRALFIDRLKHAMERCSRTHEKLSVLLLDLDGFKEVNETLGHVAGDDLLKETAERIGACLRSVDTLSRLGGDEFAILLEGDDSQGAVRVSETILERLQEPFVLEGREMIVGASIGIAFSDGSGGQDLLRQADAAMYAAKQAGKGRYEVFQARHQTEIIERLELTADLRRAIDHGELTLRYQPIVELATGRLRAVEALVRWEHPRRGELSPLRFIPLAEQTGLILALDRHVMREALRQAVAWHLAFPGTRRIGVSINVSARQLQAERFSDHVAEAVAEAGVDPSTVTLEITETMLLEDTEATLAKLEALRHIGVDLAIDDFGTGYSSLSYLRRLPANAVKIDRAFVAGVASGSEEWTLARGIVRLIHSLGLSTVGEGIERAEQLAHLRALGCQFGQGYYFARPLHAEQITELLRTAENDPAGPVIGPSGPAPAQARKGA
jgi:diguanylate cyclase (GGDEF)-like protein